jgi:hypothetical protein
MTQKQSGRELKARVNIQNHKGKAKAYQVRQADARN